jgi:hypothetical protein
MKRTGSEDQAHGRIIRQLGPFSMSAIGKKAVLPVSKNQHFRLTTSSSYPPRIQAFRDAMIKMLPRAPNNVASLESLRAMPTRRVLLAFLTWRMRFIPAKPRAVRFWSGGVTPSQAQAARPKLQPLLQKVAAGRDLTPIFLTS